tara:strand:+ start:7873 stop:8310 length:438 start_codon:yes stop_codon:yes gene_type:complete
MKDQLEIKEVTSDDGHLFDEIVAIRKKVFVDEQQVSAEDEFDEFEEKSKHYLLLLNGDPIATARWRYIGGKIKCERFALLKEYRDKGYGSHLLKRVIEDVKDKSDYIYLHAQLKAVPFYERIGFEKVGEQFTECDIEHFKMVRGE